MFCPNTLMTIGDSLRVLNAQKNNISEPSQLATLRALDRLDLSMNRITSFEEIGALFGDDACMNMTTLDMRENPVSKQHKLRDYVALMSPTLSTLDGREITQVERRFLVNREAAKARVRNRHAPMNTGNNFGPPQGVQGQLLMETQGDYDPVEERRRMRLHVDEIPRKGAGTAGEREVYTGPNVPAPDRERQKEALQAHMQFEGEVPVPRARDEGPEAPQGAQEEFNRVAREIEERREFLDTMTQAGRGGEYDAMIKAQIAEKVRELEVIDQQIDGQDGGGDGE